MRRLPGVAVLRVKNTGGTPFANAPRTSRRYGNRFTLHRPLRSRILTAMRDATVCVILLAVMAPAASAQMKTSNKARADALFAEYSKGVAPGASAMVIRDGKVIYKRATGYADVEAKTKARTTTNYRLASVSKQFTAMAVMILVEQKKLSLDAALTELFPDFPEYGAQVRVRHLLNHTSGLLAYEDLMPEDRKVPLLDRDVLNIMRRQSRTYFAPGERYRYSNSGYAVLAQIVERVSGQSFADFMRQNIFAPLKMKDTIVIERDHPRVVRRAYGYSKRANGIERTDQSMTSSVQGDGGIYSSVEDLRRWDAALYTQKLVSRAMLEQAFSPGAEAEPGVGYGFGWFVRKRGADRTLEHSGTTIGFRTFILRVPERKFTVIVLANRADADATGMARKLADIFLGPAAVSGSGADLTM